MAAAIFLKDAYSLKVTNFGETVEQTLLSRDSFDRYLVALIATPHFSTQNFEMQAKRDLLEFLYVNDSTNREYLSKLVKMPPRTFRRNMKILEEGGTLENGHFSNGHFF